MACYPEVLLFHLLQMYLMFTKKIAYLLENTFVLFEFDREDIMLRQYFHVIDAESTAQVQLS